MRPGPLLSSNLVGHAMKDSEMLDELIDRFKTLEADSERGCLERFLFLLNTVTRILWFENKDPEARLTMFVLRCRISKGTNSGSRVAPALIIAD